MEFLNTEYLSDAFKSLHWMRSGQRLCDVTLEVDGHKVMAHKNVLAAASPYFDAMFNADVSEKSKSTIALHGITYGALELIINYAYTGRTIIAEDNVQDLLAAASLMQLTALRDACCKFLIKQLDSSNCLGIREFADKHSCAELHKTSDKFILRNFTDVVLSEEFLLLSYEVVDYLISSGVSSSCSQEDVYEAIVRWVKHDIESRESFFPSLLSRVKLHLLSKNFLCKTVCSEKLVLDDSNCNHLLFEAMKYQLSSEYPSQLSDQTANSPVGLKDLIFLHGDGCCSLYDPDTDKSIHCAPTRSRRNDAGIISFNHSLYAIEGQNDGNNEIFSSGECYCPLTDTWKYIRGMSTGRFGFGIASLNGKIFVAGGSDGKWYLNSVEMYDPIVDTWTTSTSMGTLRESGRLVALGKCLYALGGRDGRNEHSSMERMDPREGKWYSMPPMNHSRYRFGADTLNGKLYVVGGSNATKSGQRFDPINSGWEPIAPLPEARSSCHLVCLEEVLYAFEFKPGGKSFSRLKYQPFISTWTSVDLYTAIPFSSATAFHGPDMIKLRYRR